MIDVAPLWGFIAISAVVVLSPGPDVLLLIRTALAGGLKPGFAAFAGVHLGNIVLTTLVASGFGLIVARNTTAMMVVQIIGGCYLLWLAWGSAQSAVRTWRGPVTGAGPGAGQPIAAATAFRQGLITNLTNPKLLIFYLSFLPRFLGDATNTFLQLELLAWVFIAVAMVWEVCVVLLAARLQQFMNRRWFGVTVDGVCAVLFAALAALVFREVATQLV